MKRLFFLILLLIPIVQAKAIYPPSEQVSWGERISFPHIYLGQTIKTEERFLEDPLNVGSSTARWTSQGCYGINLDGIHLTRKSYTLIIKSKRGPDIRIIPFETKKIYLPPDYYKIRYDKNTYTVWLGKYAE
ncbi:MAG: hypothetical protein NTW67_01380 [Candidatus Woesearchaeota archaeon]|nr:hypothetical protein [Candidatus Woesearchaeota archaeon]